MQNMQQCYAFAKVLVEIIIAFLRPIVIQIILYFMVFVLFVKLYNN